MDKQLTIGNVTFIPTKNNIYNIVENSKLSEIKKIIDKQDSRDK